MNVSEPTPPRNTTKFRNFLKALLGQEGFKLVRTETQQSLVEVIRWIILNLRLQAVVAVTEAIVWCFGGPNFIAKSALLIHESIALLSLVIFLFKFLLEFLDNAEHMTLKLKKIRRIWQEPEA